MDPWKAPPAWDASLPEHDKAYGVINGREATSDFFKNAGLIKSPFGYLPPNPGGVAGDLADITGGVNADFASAMGMLPGRIPGSGMIRRDRARETGLFGEVDTNLALGLEEGNAARSYGRDVGVGAANTAAQAYLSNAGGGEGRDAAGAAVIRARSLMPVMAQDANTALALAEMRTKAVDQKQKIQDGLNTLSTNYLNANATFLANKMSAASKLATEASTSRTATAGLTYDWQSKLAGMIPRRAPGIM